MSKNVPFPSCYPIECLSSFCFGFGVRGDFSTHGNAVTIASTDVHTIYITLINLDKLDLHE